MLMCPSTTYHGWGQDILAWCDGESSAAKLQQHMADAVADGLNHPMVARLSNVGSGQNAHSGILQLLSECGIHDLVTPAGAATHFVKPSALIRTVHHYYRREFKVRFGAEKPTS